jgi:hypothetical protein
MTMRLDEGERKLLVETIAELLPPLLGLRCNAPGTASPVPLGRDGARITEPGLAAAEAFDEVALLSVHCGIAEAPRRVDA